jgi:hypothetical protein
MPSASTDVTDHELALARGRRAVLEGADLAVGSADADVEDAQQHVVRVRDARRLHADHAHVFDFGATATAFTEEVR